MPGFDDLSLKIPLILAFVIYMSILNFMLSRVEHEKSFIIPAPEHGCKLTQSQTSLTLGEGTEAPTATHLNVIIPTPELIH